MLSTKEANTFLINVPALVYTHTSTLTSALRKSYTIQRLVGNKFNLSLNFKRSKLSGSHSEKKPQTTNSSENKQRKDKDLLAPKIKVYASKN